MPRLDRATLLGGVACAAVAGLALTAARTPADLADGEPLVAGRGSWVVEPDPEAPATTATSDGDLRIGAGPCSGPCRVVAGQTVELPERRSWLLEVEVERLAAGDRNRIFLLDELGGWHAAPGASVLGRPGVARISAVAGPGPVRVGMVVRGDGEVVRVGEWKVSPARASATHLAAWWGAVTVGVGAALLSAYRVLAATRGSLRAALVGVAGAVVAGVVAPREALDGLLLAIPGVRPEDLQADLLTDPSLPVVLQKVGGHALGFALLGAVGAATGTGLGATSVRLLAFAVGTEALQLLVPGRSSRWQDVVLDVGGGMLGYAVARLIPGGAPPAPPASAASRP